MMKSVVTVSQKRNASLGSSVVEGFGYNPVPRVADQDTAAFEHCRMGHEQLNPGIGRYYTKLVARMPCGKDCNTADPLGEYHRNSLPR
jgi:hypothetical protein